MHHLMDAHIVLVPALSCAMISAAWASTLASDMGAPDILLVSVTRPFLPLDSDDSLAEVRL